MWLQLPPPPRRIHWTSSTTPTSKLAGKLLQLPPRIYGTSSTTPHCLNYPPSNLRNIIDYPPLEIGRKTAPTTPLEFTELEILLIRHWAPPIHFIFPNDAPGRRQKIFGRTPLFKTLATALL